MAEGAEGHARVAGPPADGAPRVPVTELARLRYAAEPPLLLDVRSAAEHELGHLDGDLSLPLAELPKRSGEIPRGRPVLVYDRAGADAPAAAAFLRGHGFPNASVLEGGLDAYAREVDPSVGRFDPTSDGLLVVPLPRVDTGCLSYFLGDPVSREAIVVDPGIEPAPYVRRLRQGGWKLAAIVETHTHADHLAGHATLHLTTDAPIYVSRRSPAAYPHRPLEEGEELRAGALALRVLETPGHTQDHLTLRLGERIFTGDSLLIGACGRTDLEGGDPDRLFETFRTTYAPLPDATEVYPAHYGKLHALPERFVTTLGFERATNEALRIPTREAFVTYMTEGWPPKPADFDRIVRANLA
jgi:glyoxylase-like metal-dependent hydrolase (beta-lactamase superfamily II)/rhodanese-related sulfurtransferase